MQFYLIPSGNGFPQELTGTQADAKLALRERGLKGKPEEFPHDVPTSKAELMAYVNALLAKPISTIDVPGVTSQDAAQAVARADLARLQTVAKAADPREFRPVKPTASNMEEFILEEATVAEVERIFAVLGTRFKELANSQK